MDYYKPVNGGTTRSDGAWAEVESVAGSAVQWAHASTRPPCVAFLHGGTRRCADPRRADVRVDRPVLEAGRRSRREGLRGEVPRRRRARVARRPAAVVR